MKLLRAGQSGVMTWVAQKGVEVQGTEALAFSSADGTLIHAGRAGGERQGHSKRKRLIAAKRYAQNSGLRKRPSLLADTGYQQSGHAVVARWLVYVAPH